VPALAIGRVGWLEVALIAGVALAPVAITVAVALWARLRRRAGDA
jgi:hypothetical protein